MKYILIMIFAYFVSVSPCNAQEDLHVSVHYTNTPLNRVLADLQNRYALQFSYVDQIVSGQSITLHKKNIPWREALRLICIQTDLHFQRLSSGVIVLFKKTNDPVNDKAEKPPAAVVRGIVIDGHTREGLNLVNITLGGTLRGGVTNDRGEFVLKNIPYGPVALFFRMMGYESDSVIFFANDPVVNIDTLSLKSCVFRGEDILITAKKNPLVVSDEQLRLQPSVIVLDRQQINRKVAILEPDLFRALQTLPGITAPNDFSNELYVRGGTPDQNLISLDRMTVYQPYHLFGIAGIFNTDMIDVVNISTGGFSAQYGNRMSSVIDVRSRSESQRKFAGSGTVSLLSSKLTLDGQINDQWYYLLSGRRTYLDQASVLVKKAGLIPESIPYHFYDFMAKTVYRPSRDHSFGITGFFSNDDFSYQTKDWIEWYFDNPPRLVKLNYALVGKNNFLWGNRILGGYWEFNNQRNWLSRFTVFYSGAVNDLRFDSYYFYNRSAQDSIKHLVDSLNALPKTDNVNVDNRISDLTVRWDSELELNNDHKLLFGFQHSNIRLHYGWENLDQVYELGNRYFQIFFDVPPDSFRYRRSLQDYSFYAEDIWRLGERWIIKPGVRLEHFSGSKSSWAVSPRISVRFDYNEKIALKAATGIYYQSLFSSRERGFAGFLEIPFSTSGMPLQRSAHYIGGLEYFPRTELKVTGEAYFKTFSRLSRNNATTNTSPIWKRGKGHAWGFELTWKKMGQKISWEGYYVLSMVTRSFENKTYFTNCDQRHLISVSGNYNMPKKWILDFRWTASSGRAYRPVNYYTPQISLDPSSGDVNMYWNYISNSVADKLDHLYYYGRMPFYHRLDISLVKTIRYSKWTLKPYISIVNVYYKTNPLMYIPNETSRYYLTHEPDPQRYYYESKKAFGLPILPTFGAHFEF